MEQDSPRLCLKKRGRRGRKGRRYGQGDQLTCLECNYKYSSTSKLARHLREVHQGSKCHQCPECSRFYKRKEHMERHLKTVHDKSKKRRRLHRTVEAKGVICGSDSNQEESTEQLSTQGSLKRSSEDLGSEESHSLESLRAGLDKDFGQPGPKMMNTIPPSDFKPEAQSSYASVPQVEPTAQEEEHSKTAAETVCEQTQKACAYHPPFCGPTMPQAQMSNNALMAMNFFKLQRTLMQSAYLHGQRMASNPQFLQAMRIPQPFSNPGILQTLGNLVPNSQFSLQKLPFLHGSPLGSCFPGPQGIQVPQSIQNLQTPLQVELEAMKRNFGFLHPSPNQIGPQNQMLGSFGHANQQCIRNFQHPPASSLQF